MVETRMGKRGPFFFGYQGPLMLIIPIYLCFIDILKR
jgi:hypothetical protein